MTDFEVLMISVEWESENEYSTITKSSRPLKPTITKVDNIDIYEYDIVIYTKEDHKYFQMCIKTPLIPLLKDSHGNYNYLFNIKDDLWIIKEEWKKGQRGLGYHYCPSINTVGKIEIAISEDLEHIKHSIFINVNNVIEDFDFEQLKDDFDGELWNLITSNKSKINVDRPELRYGDRLFRYPENQLIIDFLKVYEAITKKPKHELLHSKGVSKIEKVKPIVETYKKLVNVGNSVRELPSKIAIENYDIYENRYLCLMLYNIYKMVLNNVKYSQKQLKSLGDKIKEKTEKIQVLNDPNPKVNQEDILAEIKFQEQKVEKMEQEWEKISKNMPFNEGSNVSQRMIKINYQHYNNKNSFWCQTKENDRFLINFPEQCVSFLELKQEYLIEFYGKNEKDYIDQKGKISRQYTITGIRKIEPQNERNIVQKRIANKEKLEANNWVQMLTDNEKKERDNQVKTLQNDIKKLEFQRHNLADFIGEQSDLLPLIEQKIKKAFFKQIKWRNLTNFTPSMTFIQNIKYRNALSFYQEILKSEGIELEVFDLYEQATNYGVREMPQVYELWCLVSIIQELKNTYHFQPNLQDIKSLLKVINPHGNKLNEPVTINFNGDLKGRKITLHYQKTLPNQKRPDFILEITLKNHTIYLILDAKFKNYNYKKSLNYEITDLNKKYSENDHYIFILHPCSNLIKEDQTIKMTNYGGDRIDFNQDKNPTDFPFHNYGYITHKPHLTDNLKKILGMGFEYLLDSNKNANCGGGKDPKPTYGLEHLFCLNCGGTEIETTPKNTYKNYTVNCNSCLHKTYINYCWNCQTKLFKHGRYWDYHKTSIWSSFDIHCPQCGLTFADRPT